MSGTASLGNRYWIYCWAYLLGLALALLPAYAGGTIVLGGEANFILSFGLFLKKSGFAWLSDYGLGMINMSPSGVGFNILLLSLVEKMTGSLALTNFVLIFFIYAMPFLGMFFAAHAFKASPSIAFIAALFYAINPFTMNYLWSLNQMNVFSLSAMPFFLGIILKFYDSNLRLFFWFGVVSMIFSFANTNQPMLVVLQMSVIISLVFSSIHRDRRIIFPKLIRKYLLLLGSFFLFNAWWLLGLASAVGAAQQVYLRSFADSWVRMTTADAGPITTKAFTLKLGVGDNPSYNFAAWWYNHPLANLFLLIPFVLLVVHILLKGRSQAADRFNMGCFGLLLVLIFLVKGTSAPFGLLFKALFRYFPFFYIFKSPVEKFGVLYIFVFAILLLRVLVQSGLEKGFERTRLALICFLLFCSVPIVTGNIIPDYSLGPIGIASRKYRDMAAYKEVRSRIDSSSRDGRVLSLPGMANYQLCLVNEDYKYYTGMDPVLLNTHKALLAPENHVDMLYETMGAKNYPRLLGLFNIEKAVVNEGAIPWFGYVGSGYPRALERMLGRWMKPERYAEFVIYDNTENFLPRLYTVAAFPAEKEKDADEKD